LAVPSPPAHGVRNAPADPEHAPYSRGLLAKLVPTLRTRLSRLKVRGRFGTAKRPGPLRPPRALPPAGRRQRLLGRRYPAVVATTDPCASPRPSRPPWLVSLVRPVFAGCGQPLLGCGPSRRYLRDPCDVAWTRTPRCSCGAYPFLPAGQRPGHSVKQLGPPDVLCDATSAEGGITGLQSFTHVQAPSLARPPDCTHRRTSECPGRLGLIRHAEPLAVACQGCGIATCLRRATGTAGLAPAGLRPCRLLMTPRLPPTQRARADKRSH
jgi:hypothetical protein